MRATPLQHGTGSKFIANWTRAGPAWTRRLNARKDSCGQMDPQRSADVSNICLTACVCFKERSKCKRSPYEPLLGRSSSQCSLVEVLLILCSLVVQNQLNRDVRQRESDRIKQTISTLGRPSRSEVLSGVKQHAVQLSTQNPRHRHTQQKAKLGR